MAKQKSQKRKLPAGVHETFADEVDAMQTDALKAKVVDLQKGLDDAMEFKKTQGYLEAKAEWDEVAQPANETIRHVRAKTKYVIEALKGKGAF